MLQAIRLEQAYLQHLFNLYLAPLLNFLQNIRKVLAVFRAMGFKWATKLDNYIAGLEGKITGAFQTVVAAINRHADFLYLLTLPDGFLRLVPLIHAVALSAENLSRLFTLRPLAWWYGDGATGAAGTLPTITTKTARQNIGADTRDGTGDAGAVLQSMGQLNTSMALELGS